MNYIFRNYIIIYAIVLAPIILIGVGFLFYKFKKKKPKLLIIMGGLSLGLFVLFFLLFSFINVFLNIN